MMAAYTMRVTLDDVRPTVWRRVRIRGDALLPDLHHLIQDAMGWENRHLFMFFTGSDIRTADRRYVSAEFLDDYDDESVMQADDVRVDHLLQQTGDSIGYEYDFGDGWGHRLVVDAVEADGGDLLPECVGGRRACPPEDSGGPHGFEEILRVRADVDDPEHEHIAEWLGQYDREHFAVADATARIHARRRRADAADRVVAHFPAVRSVLTHAELEYHQRLSAMIEKLEPQCDEVDPLVATAAMDKLTWMLHAIGESGLTLTGAGYLPPKVVVAMRDELTWSMRWLGTSTREIDNPEARRLRHAVTSSGLARVRAGRLVLTKDGGRLVHDPVGLWNHVARRLPVGREEYERDAGVLLLVAVAAKAAVPQRTMMIWESMKLAGWQVPPSQRNSLQYIARPTLDILELIGVVPPYFGEDDAVAQPWSSGFALQCLTR
ncbi:MULTISPECIES: plasmid pRiA4b ORF-3 family protein [Nocardiaceae]|uniref:Plasmid pRiA4b Orf3-like domain-containing protein n=1 Tax=Rhodococcoides corynebacterioides TaxID=53972 RepID=A0ABS2KVG5_9NOCA|nr:MULTISPECIES: plasmid pRiA4b ORF-3 family protein [Rhodococcus]MBM7415806.1 hypothetical protein [Rhodococcus corynebacterioides]MBP1118268.1 hypothetical protein [Rhodococcus sp. PvP016]